jgi:epoxyqueuosine reductase QueG
MGVVEWAALGTVITIGGLIGGWVWRLAGSWLRLRLRPTRLTQAENACGFLGTACPAGDTEQNECLKEEDESSYLRTRLRAREIGPATRRFAQAGTRGTGLGLCVTDSPLDFSSRAGISAAGTALLKR